MWLCHYEKPAEKQAALWKSCVLGSIKACPHSTVHALNHAQYVFNGKYGVALILGCGKTGQLCSQYDIQFPFLC